VEKPDHRQRRLLRTRGERPCCRASKGGYELPSFDADCHLIRPHQDHARCNVGHDTTPQSAGL
jgi:hypothetical protein